MPKRVDHDERRREISVALWRIASTHWLEKAGLREVETEAGMSLGQLQHYFTSKDEMLIFAMEYVGQAASERVQGRLRAMSAPPTPRTIIREILIELLPLDDNSRTGLLVQVAFFARLVHDERLQAITKGGIEPLTDLMADQLQKAMDAGEVEADRDPKIEAMNLIGLADGLANYALAGEHTAEQALAMIDYHLGRLFPPAR